MEMQEDDYNEQLQNLDVSLDEGNTQCGLLEQLSQDTTDNLLANYKAVLADREKLDGVKKEIAKLSSNQTKEYFLARLWEKLVGPIQAVIEGKESFTRLRESCILQIFLLSEIRSSLPLSQQIYKLLHGVLEKECDFLNFAYLVRYLFKIAKHIDKREPLLVQLLGLYRSIKENESNQIFAMADKCKSKELENVMRLESKQSKDEREEDSPSKSVTSSSYDPYEEEKFRLALLLLNYLSYGDSPHSRYADDEFKRTSEIVKRKPFPKVIEYLIESGRTKKWSKEFIACEFKVEDGVPKYVFNVGYLHPGLETQENYSRALLATPEKIFDQLRKDNFIVVGDKIFCKINLQTLKKISQLSKIEVGEYTNESLQQMVSLLKFWLENPEKKIAHSNPNTMQEEANQETVDKYLVYTWIIFSKFYYEHERNELDFGFLFEQVNVGFLNNMLRRCLEFQGKDKDFADLFAEELVKVAIHLLYKGEYATQANYTSETSRLVESILLKMKSLPTKWKGLKKIKALLDKWGETITEINPNLTALINKFLDSFFNPALKLKSRSFSQFQMLPNPHYSKSMGTQISTKIRQLLQKSITRLQSLSPHQQPQKQQQFPKLNNILYKMLCLYMSRLKIPESEQIADLLFKLYQNWAYGIDLLYCFRTWIIYYSPRCKDQKAVAVVRAVAADLLASMGKFGQACASMPVADVFKPIVGREKPSQQTAVVADTVFNLRLLINNLQLKQRQDIYGPQLYQTLIQLLQSLTKTLGQLHSRILSQFASSPQTLSPILFQTYLSSQPCMYDILKKHYTELTHTVRFFICNLNRLIENKDQLHLLEQASTLLKQLANKQNIESNNLKLINNVFGFNLINQEDCLTKWQLLNSRVVLQGVREEYSFNKEEYTPGIVVSVLYARLRADYLNIVRNLLTTISVDKDKEKEKEKPAIKEKQNYTDIYQQAKSHLQNLQNKPSHQQSQTQKLQKQSQLILSNIVLPSINIFGPSYFNNKLEEKGKEEEAYGILCDQFNLLFNQKLGPKEIICLHGQLASFFEVVRDKGKKVINKQISQMQRNNRRNVNQGHRAAILTELALMGYRPQALELAMEHVDDDDPDNIMNWLQANQYRMDQLLTSRAIHQSTTQSLQARKVQLEKSAQIPLVGYNELVKNIETGTKLIIKSLKNDLFSQLGNRIKDLIFVCLDSFQNQDFRNKQLTQFSELMFKELDKLNTNFQLNRLEVITSTLQTILLRKADLIPVLHDRQIVNTLLSLLQKSIQPSGQKILSIINLSLPNPTEKCSPQLKQYLCYIGDVLLGSNIVSNKEMEILCKMVKCKDGDISQKVLKIVCKGISKGIIREKLFSILGLVLDSDREFSCASIQLELKSFIIENHDYKKKGERFLKLDQKKFALAFTRYEDHPYFLQVLNKILTKRNGKLALQLQTHNLFHSEILSTPFLTYSLPDTHKTLLQNLVHQITKQQNQKHRIEYIRELYKTLQFYKLLIPFCLRLRVDGQGTTFVEWLVEKEFPRARGMVVSFIAFLFVRNGLYLGEDESFSDYLIAQVMYKYMKHQQLRKCQWHKLLIIYLLQLKNFNTKTHHSLTPDNPQTLKHFLQHELSLTDPINYLLVSESLYLIMKKQLIDSLMGKYKLENQDEGGLERQFLNMDLFYAWRRRRPGRGLDQQEGDQYRLANGRLNLQRLFVELSGDGQGENGDIQEENQDMEALQVLRRMLLLRERSSELVAQSSANLSLLVPIQPEPQPQPQQQARQPQQQQQPQQQEGQQGQQGQQQQQEQVNQIHEQKPEVKEQQKVQQKEKESKMEEQKVQVKHYLSDILQKFLNILPKIVQAKTQTEWKFVQVPKTSLKQSDLKDANYNSTLKEPRVILDQKFAKTNVFKERIIQIAEIVDPNEKMVINEEKKTRAADQREVRELRDSYENGLRRYTINRMIGGEREREREAAVQPLNVNRILNGIPEYIEPPKVVEEKPKEKEEKKEEKAEQKVEEKVEEKKQVPKESEMVEEKQEQKPVQEENKPEQKPEEQNRLAQQQQMIPVEPQQPRMQEQPLIMPVDQPSQMVEEPVEPHRQILAMLGLPQTFLRDLGIDTFSFDSLPEDMQIEQLNVLMEQQHVANQNQPNQANNPNQPNQQPTDLMSQNAAFLASLDPQLRAQMLLEATPQFLMTLPPALRAEAENHRQRQIAQMLHDEQQMEMEQERINKARAPKALIYPQMTADTFPDIDKETAMKISQSILIKLPKFNLEIFRVLLQNKKTQKSAITTLISYIKNVEHLSILECTYNKDKKQWQKQKKALSGSNRKVFIEEILQLIENHLTNCIYKDEKFLTGKHDYHNYAEIGLPVNTELQADEDGYYPLYELIDIAIDNHSYGLLNRLVKKVTDLPKRLRKRIIRGIRDEKFNQDFYSNLEGLNDNEEFKKTFMKEFPEEKPIKIETLSRILKYNFSKVPYLKKLHVDTLKRCKGTQTKQIYDFLNQIYSSYTVQDIKQIEPLLLEHKQIHNYIIKYLYESGKSLEGEPIGLILKFPHLLDFETKRFIFQRNPKLHRSRHRCVIQVNRLNLFQESFNQIMGKTLKELEGSIKVVFMDEQAEDAGGPKKEWFLSLSKQIFDPRYALFEPSSSGNTYQPNPKSYVNTQHLSYFKFIGRFFAKALCEGMLIDAFFTRSFYKMILGHELQLKDLEEQDYSFYKSMLWLKDNPFKGDEEYTFSYVYDYFGKIVTRELMPGGESIPVTEENKLDYIHKYTMAMMRDAIGAQIGKFLEGFYQVLPKDSISFFEPTELELLMSGMPSVDLKDLKMNTDYQGYSPNDPVIKWYWQILEQYTNEDLARLIQFITGTSKIPLQGFSKLQGMHGPQKISIHKDCHIDQLPKSHTCFNQLDLPNYPTKQMLKERLRVAITWGSQGFGFM